MSDLSFSHLLEGFAKPRLSVNLNFSTEALAQAGSIQILHSSLRPVSGDPIKPVPKRLGSG